MVCCRGTNKDKRRNVLDGNCEGSIVKYNEMDMET